MAYLPKPSDCFGCPLYGSGLGFSVPEGSGSIGVMVMAEALGEKEEEVGLPMRPYAQGGAIMERAFRRASTLELPITRDMFKLYNVCQCRPPDNRLEHTGYEFAAIAHCSVHRNKVVNDFVAQHRGSQVVRQPVILATGNVPFRTMTGITGERQSVTYLRGYPFRSIETGALILPTFHFAYVARTRKLIGVLVHDVYRAVMLAKHGFQELPRSYKTHPTPLEAKELRDFVLAHPDKLVSVDIETADIERGSHVWPEWYSIQFSLAPGTGYFFDVEPELLRSVIAPILSSQNPKVGHNIWRFDNRVLREKYSLAVNGRVDDTMWMFHHWEPDLTIEAGKDEKGGGGSSLSTRAGLQFAASFFGMDFAWKHLNESDKHFYGIADVDACQRIMSKLPGFMKSMNVWHGYERLVMGNEKILMDMHRRGIPIDDVGRLELHDILTEQSKNIDDDLQKAYPDHLRNVEPQSGLVNAPNTEKGKYRKVFLVTKR